jgi:hypothetical protein
VHQVPVQQQAGCVACHYIMKLRKTLIIFFSTALFNVAGNGQGRIDTDPILHNIWWTAYKIDSDKSLIKVFKSKKGVADTNSYFIYYYKINSLCKVVNLAKASFGTQMETFYFNDSKPIFISVKKNNISFPNDQNQVSKTVLSFEDIVDTSGIGKKTPYNIFYNANYYFDKEKVRYANVMSKGKIRVDKKDDIIVALNFYSEAKDMLIDK